MREVHPAFDPITSTWFVGNEEARTIRELLAKLGKDIVAIGYQPIGQAVPFILREPHDLRTFARTPKKDMLEEQPIEPAIDDVPRLPLAAKLGARTARAATDERHQREAQRKRDQRARQKAKRMFGVGFENPLSQATAQDRERCTDIENEILDRWAKGESGPSIAAALGVTRPYVSANVVWHARLLGDPRAVVRCPNSIGITRNKKASPTSGSHRAKMYRQRMAELRAMRACTENAE
jgi:hypothetical protein